MEFAEFAKMPRLSREVIVTEKIDGTNAQIAFADDGKMFVGSRTRWITPDSDNHGFARWAYEHEEQLRALGPGRHFGEWWGSGIQRGYGLTNGDKRFSLFNVSRWAEERPDCCGVVPLLYRGDFNTTKIEGCLATLAMCGSMAAPGFMRPEGVVVFHVAGNVGFKKTIEKDEMPKGMLGRQLAAEGR